MNSSQQSPKCRSEYVAVKEQRSSEPGRLLRAWIKRSEELAEQLQQQQAASGRRG